MSQITSIQTLSFLKTLQVRGQPWKCAMLCVVPVLLARHEARLRFPCPAGASAIQIKLSVPDGSTCSPPSR